jgi:hypothetical protein
MFDVDTFIADCIAARGAGEPRRAINEILAKAMSRPSDVQTQDERGSTI